MMASGVRVGVVGATGVAGAEILRQLRERAFPVGALRVFGTGRSAGATVDDEAGGGATIELLDAGAVREIDVALFAAGRAVAREWAPRFAAAGAVVVDVSSAFREEPAVPLVVPEVNGSTIVGVGPGIVALASPTTALLAAVLAPLGAVRRVTRAIVSTYQGAATAGTRTLRALGRETVALLGGRGMRPSRAPLAFDCRPLIGALDADGAAAHERAVPRELRRVLGDRMPALQMTAVRVPVFTGLALSIVAELDAPVSSRDVEAALRRAPGLLVHANDDVPTPRAVAGSPAIHVGRIRPDPSHPSAVALWVAADGVVNARASAAVSTAELAIRSRDA